MMVALMAAAMVVLRIACHTGSATTVIAGCTGFLGRASTSAVFWSSLLWMVIKSIAAVLLVRWCSVLATIARIVMSMRLLIMVIRLATVWVVLSVAPCCCRSISDDWTLPRIWLGELLLHWILFWRASLASTCEFLVLLVRLRSVRETLLHWCSLEIAITWLLRIVGLVEVARCLVVYVVLIRPT